MFYVGKGKGDRVVRTGDSHRNIFFLRYINKYECDYEILEDGLTEKEAYIKENAYYQEFKKNGECECNISDTSCCTGGSGLSGEKNGMFQRTHSLETRKKISEANLEFNKENVNSNAHSVLAYNSKTKKHLLFETRKEATDYFNKNIDWFSELSEMSCYRIIQYSNKKHYSYNSWGFKDFPRGTKNINEDDIVSSFVDYVECEKRQHPSTRTYEEDVTTKERQRSFYFNNKNNC